MGWAWAVEGDGVSWGRRKWLAVGVLAVGGLHGWGWMLGPVAGVGAWGGRWRVTVSRGAVVGG